MKKFFCFVFLFFIFSISLIFPELSLRDVIDDDNFKFSIQSTTGSGVLSRYLCFSGVHSTLIKDSHSFVIGEQVEIEANNNELDIFVDKLGVRILNKEFLNSCIILSGISKLLPYYNLASACNVFIKCSKNKIVIASPKFIN